MPLITDITDKKQFSPIRLRILLAIIDYKEKLRPIENIESTKKDKQKIFETLNYQFFNHDLLFGKSELLKKKYNNSNYSKYMAAFFGNKNPRFNLLLRYGQKKHYFYKINTKCNTIDTILWLLFNKKEKIIKILEEPKYEPGTFFFHSNFFQANKHILTDYVAWKLERVIIPPEEFKLGGNNKGVREIMSSKIIALIEKNPKYLEVLVNNDQKTLKLTVDFFLNITSN
ncbi:MAG: hypothetical protein ABII01_00200 [Candidatus Woesearchaeota archaeon]